MDYIQNSYKNLVDDKEYPILKRGGPSQSKVLNQINKRIISDQVKVAAQIQDLDRKEQLTSIYLQQQAVGIQALVSNLQTLIPVAPPGQGRADFFSTDFIDNTNTANIDEDFGQATLPILSVQEKMNGVDAQGNVWVPTDSKIQFYYQSSYTQGTIPDDTVFFSSVEDYLGIGPQPNTFFLIGETPSTKYVFIKGVLPQALNTSNLSNRFTFYPIPAFSHELIDAYYRTTDGTWNLIDITYLLGYTTSTTPPQVTYLGPTRLHFPTSEINQICIVLKVNGWFGVQQFGVQLVEYSSTANLVVDMSTYNPTVLTSTLVGGKDQLILNAYPITITNTLVSIALSQTASMNSPIINSISSFWAA